MSATAELYDSLLARLGPEGIAVERGTGRPFGAYPLPACCWLTHADGADSYVAPQGHQRSKEPAWILDRMEALVVRVEGASPIAGATYGDHHDTVKQIVNRVLCAIHAWARGDRSGYAIGRAGWSTPDRTENPVGAVYQFGLTIPEHVIDDAPALVRVGWVTQKTIIVDGVEYEFDAVPSPPPAP